MNCHHTPSCSSTTDATRRRWLHQVAAGLLAGALPPVWAGQPARPLPLPVPLAEDAPPDVHPGGYLVSEKFDGVRAVWDGQRLRFRSGLPLSAPDGFIGRLPAVPLDGELWLDRGRFEDLSGLVRRRLPVEADWRAVRCQVFDLPAGTGGLAERVAQLQSLVRRQGWPALQAVAQQTLPDRPALQRRLAEVLAAGGEGLVLRRDDAPYAAGRSAAMLKLKPLQDAEATVVGYEPGRGRHAGRLGALRVRSDDGRQFSLGSGFSDAQRNTPPALGQRVTFVYRGRTETGLPRFASFLRERTDGI
jgi:DNA ligase 1